MTYLPTHLTMKYHCKKDTPTPIRMSLGITYNILATSLNDKYFSYFKMSSFSLFTNMFCVLSWETEVLFDCSFAFVLLQLHPYVPWLRGSSDQSKELFFDHSLQTTFTSLYSLFRPDTLRIAFIVLSLLSLQQTLFLYASAANTSYVFGWRRHCCLSIIKLINLGDCKKFTSSKTWKMPPIL